MPKILATRIADLQRSRTPYVHARVVLAEKPTSAKPGDEAIIFSDGSMEGFVGGSCADSTVRSQSVSVLTNGNALLLRIAPNQAFGIVSIAALGSKRDTHWEIEFTADKATVVKAEGVNPLARLKVSGTPEAMDLYLWGRIDSSDSRIKLIGEGEEIFKQLMQVAVL